jgi:hypothetical protein
MIICHCIDRVLIVFCFKISGDSQNQTWPVSVNCTLSPTVEVVTRRQKRYDELLQQVLAETLYVRDPEQIVLLYDQWI